MREKSLACSDIHAIKRSLLKTLYVARFGVDAKGGVALHVAVILDVDRTVLIVLEKLPCYVRQCICTDIADKRATEMIETDYRFPRTVS